MGWRHAARPTPHAVAVLAGSGREMLAEIARLAGTNDRQRRRARAGRLIRDERQEALTRAGDPILLR